MAQVTVKACSRAPRRAAHCPASSQSAVLSAPPETATPTLPQSTDGAGSARRPPPWQPPVLCRRAACRPCSNSAAVRARRRRTTGSRELTRWLTGKFIDGVVFVVPTGRRVVPAMRMGRGCRDGRRRGATRTPHGYRERQGISLDVPRYGRVQVQFTINRYSTAVGTRYFSFTRQAYFIDYTRINR